MRIGDFEIPGGLLVMPAFALIVAVLLLWTWYYYAKQRGEMKDLAVSRGWSYLGKNDPEFSRLLLDFSAGTDWIVENIIRVEGEPARVYLFTYQASARTSSESTEIGAGCLSGRSLTPGGEVVVIDPRPPLIGKLVENLAGEWVEVGGADFRERFLVQSARADTATALVTRGVQEIVLQRKDCRLKWSRVSIAGRRVLVTVTYRLKDTEWDDLIGLTARLRAALP